MRLVIESRPSNGRLLNGIGHDAAVWQPSRSHRSVITSDTLIEGRHFTREAMNLRDAGWRAMASNLSDLAAMSARPVLATVALSVPREIAIEDIVDLYEGMLDVAGAARCALAGGDTTRSDILSITIAAVGEARPTHVKGRAGARPGDVAAVTGELGASRAGLFASRASAALEPQLQDEALRAHRRPVPRLEEGRWLGASSYVRAVMDLSDGISTDLARMCAMSSCGAAIDAAEVPVAGSAAAIAESMGEDPVAFALAGGEDFELLAAIEPRAFAHLASRFRKRFGRPLYAIGRFTEGSGLRLRKGRTEQPLAPTGYDHFAT